MESDSVEMVLRFWVTFLRQTDETRSNQDKEAIQTLFQLFTEKFQKIMRYTNSEENLAAFMILIEELILADFKFEDFPKFLQKLFLSCEREVRGSTIRLKNDFFSIITSFLLKMQNRNLIQQVPLDFILESSYNEMITSPSNNPRKNETNLRNQVTALFGRLIFINTDAVLKFIESKQIHEKMLIELLKVK